MSGATAFQKLTENYIRSLTWDEGTSDELRTIVAGNIRTFAAYLTNTRDDRVSRIADRAQKFVKLYDEFGYDYPHGWSEALGELLEATEALGEACP